MTKNEEEPDIDYCGICAEDYIFFEACDICGETLGVCQNCGDDRLCATRCDG